MHVQIVADDQDWDKLIEGHGQIFHYSDWIDRVLQSFGGRCLRALITEGERIVAVAPIYQGGCWANNEDFRIGAIGYGGPVALDGQGCDAERERERLVGMIRVMERYLGGECCGVRGVPVPQSVCIPGLNYGVTHILSLAMSEDEVFEKCLKGSVRTAIRKARKSGLIVREVSNENIDEALTLIQATQRGVGATYTTPRPFLERLIVRSCHITPLLLGAYEKERLCAVSLFLLGGRDAFHLLNGWDRRFSALCPNQLILWEGIIRTRSHGATSLNLGESGYESLATAKAKWGARPRYVLHLDAQAVQELTTAAYRVTPEPV